MITGWFTTCNSPKCVDNDIITYNPGSVGNCIIRPGLLWVNVDTAAVIFNEVGAINKIALYECAIPIKANTAVTGGTYCIVSGCLIIANINYTAVAYITVAAHAGVAANSYNCVSGYCAP